MHVVSFILLALLSCALSKPNRNYALDEVPRVPKDSPREIDRPPASPGNQVTTTGKSILVENPETVETLFIPEDPSRYAEIVGHVKELLQQWNTFDRDEDDSAKGRNGTREELEAEGDRKVPGEPGNYKKAQETRKGEPLETRNKVPMPETWNSSSTRVPFDEGQKYLRGNVEVRDSEGETLNPSMEIQDEDEKDEKIEPDENDILEAANFGLRAMHDLYFVKEPALYSMGLFLDTDNPARFVATFNDQTEEARTLAKYGFAVLQGTTMFMKKFPDAPKELLLSRRSHGNPLERQCPSRGVPDCPAGSMRYRTADGSCNNLQNLWWGSAMSPMQRFLPAVYHDGIQSIRRSKTGRPLPSAREITSIIHGDRDVPLASVTHMLMQWGQFVDHDLTATGQSRGFNGTIPQCCQKGGVGFQSPEFLHPECLPIQVNVQDSFYGPLGVKCLEFLRSGSAPREDCEFGPREQLSQVTSYLDASTVYSSNAFHSDSLRLFRNGLLQYGRIQSRKPVLPRDDSDLCRRGSLSTSCFRAGDGRLGEQPALTSIHVVFLRLHNRIATKLAAMNFHWSDEKLFQETRRIVGAVVQHITYREYLPIVLGQDVMRIFDLELLKKGYYEGYDPTVNPNIANGFATAAYRFGHSLIQHSFVRFDSNHNPLFNNVSIHDEFSNPVNLETAGSVDRLLLGLINQPSQRRDEFISEELTNHLFQTPRFPFGMDLASLNIQRGRDHGIPPYVQWREPCGLSPIRSFDDLGKVMSPASVRKFRLVYASVEDIDLFSAGLAENSVTGGLVGPTFACIIGQQFSNLRKGDRFWYENAELESSFTPGQLQQIRRVTLAQVLCTTMDNIETIQPFVFLIQDTARNQRVRCNDPLIGRLDLQLWEDSPLEFRSREKDLVKANTKTDRYKGPTKPETKVQNKLGLGANSAQEKLFPSKPKPLKANIHQQNRIVVKKPLGQPDNVTIFVQNNAVNNPVFVNDAIYGSPININNLQHQQPNRPLYEFVDHRPISQDPERPQRPKPIPTTLPYTVPYVPFRYQDPSNPNPLHHGFRSRYPMDDVVFETYSMTSPRPTLYTYYTNIQQRPTTRRPEQMDNYPNNHGHQDYVTTRPSMNSWSNLEPHHQVDDPLPSRPVYGNVGNVNSQVENANSGDNWQNLQHQYRPINQQDGSGDWNQGYQGYQGRPDSRPIDQGQSNDRNDNWHPQGHRPIHRPYVHDDRYQDTDYTTWSSVSSYQASDKLDDSRDTNDFGKPYHQLPNKRPIQADPDGWSTLPTYQKGSTGTRTTTTTTTVKDDPGNWSKRPLNIPHNSDSYYNNGKLVLRPVIIYHEPVKIKNHQGIINDRPTEQTGRPDSSYTRVPDKPTAVYPNFDELPSSVGYQRPNRPSTQSDNQNQYTSGQVFESYPDNHSRPRPIQRPLSSHSDELSDNLPYQSSTRPGSYQSFKPEKISKPPKVHSVTIVTETVENVSQPGYQVDRKENRVTSEIPTPLLSQVRNHKPDIRNDIPVVRKPGQYYYDKNVLRRYPEEVDGIRGQSSEETIVERHKVIAIDEEKSFIDALGTEMINKTDGTMNEDNGNYTTQSTIESGDSIATDDDVDDDLGETFLDEENRTYWLNPEEDSRLPSTPEMPTIIDKESSSAEELPQPIKCRNHGS